MHVEWTKLEIRSLSFTFVPELWQHHLLKIFMFATHALREGHGQHAWALPHRRVTVQSYVGHIYNRLHFIIQNT